MSAFLGLGSPELHLERMLRRGDRGGHDIPEKKIRERWRGSRENLIRLLPNIDHLRVDDNPHEADPAAGIAPGPPFGSNRTTASSPCPTTFRACLSRCSRSLLRRCISTARGSDHQG